MPTPTLQQGLRRSLAVLAACLALCGALELVLRAVGFEPRPAADPIVIWNVAEDRALGVGGGLHRFVPRQLWEPRPGAWIPSSWAPDGESVNADAFRGPRRERAKPAGVLRIATLGDSSTFGYGVPYASTYSARLEAELAEAGVRAEVLDFGVIGFTLLQGIERYADRVRAFQPDVVVAAFGSINDHLLAQGLPDAEKIAAFAREPSGLAALGAAAREHSRLVQWCAGGLDALRGAREEAPPVGLAQDELAPHVGEVDLEQRLQGRRRVSLDEFRAALARFSELVRADGASLVVFSLPRRPGVEFNSPVLRQYSQAIEEHARASGDVLCDGRADFRAYRQVEHGDPSLFFLDGDDVHPSPRGHRRLARALAAAVLAARPAR